MINVVIWTSVLNEYNKFVSCKAASTNILRSSLLVLLFLSRKFKAWRLTANSFTLDFESNFYLETWRIVLEIFLLLYQNTRIFLIFRLFLLEKKMKNWIAVNKIVKGNHIFDLEVTNIILTKGSVNINHKLKDTIYYWIFSR